MKTFIILLALVATVRCNICCFPNEWQATSDYLVLDSAPSGNAVIQLTFDEYFDTNDEIVRTDLHQYNMSILTLFKENKAYLFNDKSCSKYDPGNWSDIIRCIPSNAKASPKFRLGVAPGINVIDYTWELPRGDTVTVGVTDKCTPVLLSDLYQSSNLDEIDFNIQKVENFIPHIQDRQKLVVPKICQNKTELLPMWPLMGEIQHQVVKKFVDKRFKL